MRGFLPAPTSRIPYNRFRRLGFAIIVLLGRPRPSIIHPPATKKTLPLILAAALSCFQAAAQTPPSPQPEFEAVSIHMVDPHPAPLPPGASPISPFPTNRFFAHNVNLRLIIAVAFGADERYIEGPEWLDSNQYNIDAKAEGDTVVTDIQIHA